MSNKLRIVYDNAADRGTLTASSEAGSLVAANLRKESKAALWRSTGTTATLTLVYAAAELVGCVALPFTNLSSTSTIRVRGYTNSTDAVPVFDTGDKPAAGYVPLGLFGWGSQAIGMNAYSYGGGTYGSIWFDHKSVKKLVITITDTQNAAGYIEAARLVVGAYFEPEINADYGAAISLVDQTKNERSESGDLRSDVGTRAKKLSFDLKSLTPVDRTRVWEILTACGTAKSLFLSLHADGADSSLEQTYQIYGKLSASSRVSHAYFNTFSAPFEIEES